MNFKDIAILLMLLVLLSVWFASMTAYTGCFLLFWLHSKIREWKEAYDEWNTG